MSTIVTRAGKGSPLTNAEVDDNFTNLNADKLESSSYTAADVLAKLLTVDGVGSGLDADLLDGQSSAYYLAASAYTAADVLAKLLTVDGSGSGLDADTLDGANWSEPAAIGNVTPASGAFTTLDVTGTLTLNGNGRRIVGDMSSGTLTNQVWFQSSVVNGQSTINVMPNGTNTNSGFICTNSSDPANHGRALIYVNSGTVGIYSQKAGTGTTLPLVFYMDASEKMRLATDGTVTIDKTSAGAETIALYVRNLDSGSVNTAAGVGFHAHATAATAKIVSARVDNGASIYDLTLYTFDGASVAEMLRLKGTGSATAKGGAGLWASDGQLAAINPNLLLNGGMDVYTDGGTAVALATTNVWSPFDGWGACQDTTATGSLIASPVAPTGFSRSLRIQRTAGSTATGYIRLGQVMETFDSVKLQGKKVTLSFWCYKGANFSGGTILAAINFSTGTDQTTPSMYVGSWAGYTYASSTITPTTAWVKYTVTGTVPANAQQVGVHFSWQPSGTAGADDFINIVGIKLEQGEFATAWDYSETLAETQRRCMRRYQIINDNALFFCAGYQSAGNYGNSWFYNFPVEMRATPTINRTAGSTSNVTTVSTYVDKRLYQLLPTITATGYFFFYIGTVKADARL
jgi:hypothetical protein